MVTDFVETSCAKSGFCSAKRVRRARSSAVESVSYTHLDGEQPELRLLAPHFVFAPCDTVSATLEVWLDGTRIGALPLRLAAPVKEISVKKNFLREALMKWL